jgi:hypothetical protein
VFWQSLTLHGLLLPYYLLQSVLLATQSLKAKVLARCVPGGVIALEDLQLQLFVALLA